MLKLLFLISFFSFCFAPVSSQKRWASSSHLMEYQDYYLDVMQKTILDLEKFGFCNMKLYDVTQTLNEQMYKWLVSGTVTYTNGFVTSIQKIDVTEMTQRLNSRVVNNITVNTASVSGELNFRDLKVGFDVLVNLTDGGEQRYTGLYTYSLITMPSTIEKDLNTHEITTSSRIVSLSGGSGVRMLYLPANNVTEVLSRRFLPSSSWNSITSWGSNIIAPFMLKAATTNIQFPGICYGCYL